MDASSREWHAQNQREQLHHAARNGDLDRIERLLAKGFPVNRFDSIGKTPLHCAVMAERFDAVEMLLEAGADVNAHDERWIGNTPLSDNIKECSVKMVERLLKAGADPTIRGWMQLNALDRVSSRKDVRKVRKMLEEAAERIRRQATVPKTVRSRAVED